MIARSGDTPDDLEAKLNHLEAITRRVENPGTGLAEALQLGEEGAGLCEEIEAALSQCDARVQALLERIRPREQ
jgi:exodeoxyribonuclease VII small subunit